SGGQGWQFAALLSWARPLLLFSERGRAHRECGRVRWGLPDRSRGRSSVRGRGGGRPGEGCLLTAQEPAARGALRPDEGHPRRDRGPVHGCPVCPRAVGYAGRWDPLTLAPRERHRQGTGVALRRALAVCVLTRRLNGGADSLESSPHGTLSRGGFSAPSLVTPIRAAPCRERVVPVWNTDL